MRSLDYRVLKPEAANAFWMLHSLADGTVRQARKIDESVAIAVRACETWGPQFTWTLVALSQLTFSNTRLSC